MANLHSLGDRGTLPKSGKPGDVYYHKGVVYLTLADGKLTPLQRLHDTFAQLGITAIVGAPGRDGRDGVDGKNGRDGVDGKDGKDGAKGDRGDISVVGDQELQAAIAKLKAKQAAAMAIVLEVLNRRPESPAVAIARAHMMRIKKALES